MIRELIETISENDKKELIKIYERISSLEELIIDVSKEKEEGLYSQIYNDLEKSNASINEWWTNIAHKYNLKFDEKGKWELNFETNEVFLIIS